jgi:hypothetical protein
VGLFKNLISIHLINIPKIVFGLAGVGFFLFEVSNCLSPD